jgi:hypothetical protein
MSPGSSTLADRISQLQCTTFYALVKDGELSLVKIGRRSFVQAEDLDYRAHLGSTGAAPMPE